MILVFSESKWTFLDGVLLQVDPGELEPIPHQELLWLFVMLTLLLFVARGLGEIAQRFDLPAVVGELTAGIVLGPSVLGAMSRVASVIEVTTGHGIDLQFGIQLIGVMSWIGLIMLIILTGLETDLELIVSKATEATVIAVASIVVPFALGFAFAWHLPIEFIAEDGSRLIFSLFVAVAMSISAIPVIAKILMDMEQIRRDFGQVTLAAGMINDTVGWILLALVAGLERTGQIELTSIGQTVFWLAIFLGAGFTMGPRAVRRIFVWVDNVIGGQVAKITTLIVLALGAGSITHALELEVVLGAFVVGILVGQVKRFDYDTKHAFEVVTIAVFAPIFFAAAGLRVDLGRLVDPEVFAVAMAALAIAVVGKFSGSYVGAKVAGLGHWEGITMGAGLNARGAMEIIVALVGFSLGVLTIEMYSIIVMIAIVTSIMAPPMLRWTLPRIPMTERERERLKREERQRHSFLGNVARVLMPTRGGVDTQYAAQLLRLLVRNRDIEVTSLYVTEESGGRVGMIGPFRRFFSGNSSQTVRTATNSDNEGEEALEYISSQMHPSTDEEDRNNDDDCYTIDLRSIIRGAEYSVSSTILEEAEQGYDFLVLGETGRNPNPSEPLFSEVVDRVVQETPCPLMVVSSHYEHQGGQLGRIPLRRILLPTVGTEYNRHAAEVAFAIAIEADAFVEVIHVVNEPQLDDRFVEQPDLSQAIEIGEEIVDREAEMGRHMGAEVLTRVIVGEEPERDIVEIAGEDDVDLIVLGSNLRPVTRRAFFGHRVEYILKTARCPVAVISSL